MSDGILAPFALHKSGRWSDPWPKPDGAYDAKVHQLEDIPASWLGGVPLPQTWFLRWVDGRASTLRLREPVSYGNHCQSAWGLRTDQSPAVRRESHREPVAVSVSVEGTLDRVERLTQDSPERPRFASILDAAFRELETEQIATERRRGEPVENGRLKYRGHPIDSAARRSVPIEIESLYRSDFGSPGNRLYYVEASTKYPNPLSPPDGKCWGLSLFHGWLREDSGGNLSWVRRSLILSDCDGVEASTNIPLAKLRLDGRIYLIVYTHYYESETYSILEFDGQQLRETIETPGGGC